MSYNKRLKKKIDKKAIAVVAVMLSIFGIILSIIIVIPIIINVNPTNASITTSNVNSADASEERHTVPLDQIVSGGPPPDGIPSIDNPKFISVQEASKFLEDSELVLGLNINGDIRSYPLQILVWHEIVNDEVGGVPVAVTYCPLCFTNQVFNRTIDDVQEVVEFGTSGKLYNSNLVMYDRTSKSLWSQALAEGILGKHAGTKLERVPFDIAYWKEWKELYPDSKVLSRDTGSNRPYGADPYGDYYTNSDVLFPVLNRDDRLGLKEIVVGLENKEQHKAYKLQEIENKKVINDQVNGKPIALFSLYPFMIRGYDPIVEDGEQKIALQFNYNAENNKFIDKQTGSVWNFEGKAISGQMKGKQLTRLPFDEGFWFEWVAFHPKTEIYPG
ncbi:MAG TPA: DUF3179 domain-containing protein [Nitrososphaeraceae archaeon]|nr:DUF3179 domain-containing protein [Nitrososphaeraceae archaeon]